MAQSTITTVNPGNIVVPLSAIIDRLQGKLSAADLNALLLAVVTDKSNEIRPGDLITADLMNQILSNIADLKFRVAQLELGAGSVAGQVMIFRPLPGEQFRAEQDMTIEGKNLGVLDGSCIIKINNTTVTVYRPGGNNEKLTVNIPPMAVGVGGQTALLTVANANSSAERQIYLLPAHDLIGHVDLSWINAEPLTPATGEQLTLQFNAKSRANLDASYLITPLVSRVSNATEWNGQLAVLNQDKVEISSRQIQVAAGGEASFHVRLKTIPSVPGTTAPSFVLSVGVSAGSVSDGTGPLFFKVGSPAELPDPNVSLAYDSSAFLPTQDFGSYTRALEEDTVTVKPNGAGVITMTSEISSIGIYRASAETVTGATNWTVRPHPQDPTSYPISEQDLKNPDGSQKKARISPRFQFIPGEDAGDSGEVRLKIARDGASTSRSVLVLVKKG